jgi:hypothetical protein
MLEKHAFGFSTVLQESPFRFDEYCLIQWRMTCDGLVGTTKNSRDPHP